MKEFYIEGGGGKCGDIAYEKKKMKKVNCLSVSFFKILELMTSQMKNSLRLSIRERHSIWAIKSYI